ncbi:MAG: hypothetical protein ACJ71J_11060, partial [Nitrososphaeraceae archaeon]
AVSKAMQRDIRYRIRRKLEILRCEELPLLLDKGFLGQDKSMCRINQIDLLQMLIVAASSLMTTSFLITTVLMPAGPGGLAWLRYRRLHGKR